MGCADSKHDDLNNAQSNQELSCLIKKDLVEIKALFAKYPFNLYLALQLLPKDEIDKLTEHEKDLKKVAASISPDMKIQIENKMKNDLSERTSSMLNSKEEYLKFKMFIEQNKSLNEKIQGVVQRDIDGIKYYLLLPYSVFLENLEDHVYKHEMFKQFDQLRSKLENMYNDITKSEKTIDLQQINKIYLAFDTSVFDVIGIIHE